MGGGPVYTMNAYVWGIDLVEEQFLASCGIPSRPYMSRVPRKCIAEFSVNAQATGTLQNTDWAAVRTPPCPLPLAWLLVLHGCAKALMCGACLGRGPDVERRP
jgi:hypothetical protein